MGSPPAAAALLTVETDQLSIACEAHGPSDGPVALLVHGWPDDARAWDGVAPALAAVGKRVIVPHLRGFGVTRFLESSTHARVSRRRWPKMPWTYSARSASKKR